MNRNSPIKDKNVRYKLNYDIDQKVPQTIHLYSNQSMKVGRIYFIILMQSTSGQAAQVQNGNILVHLIHILDQTLGTNREQNFETGFSVHSNFAPSGKNYTSKLQQKKAEALFYTRSLKNLPDSITSKPYYAKNNKVYLDLACHYRLLNKGKQF